MGDVTHTVTFKGIAVTAQQDFFEVKASTGASVLVHGFVLTQETETGDAAEEMLRLTTNRCNSTGTTGSGGATATVQTRIRGGGTFGGTVKTNDTTKLTGSPDQIETDLEVYTWNERVPFVWWWPPEARPVIRPGEFWTLELETTPADSLTICGTLYLEQIGG